MKVNKISYLTSCMGRVHHLKQTFIQNIKDAENSDIEIEFVLLNWNSNDGLNDWFFKVVVPEVSQQKDLDENNCIGIKNSKNKIKYLRTKKQKYFHMSQTKNITAKNSSGNILCWVDADNYITNGFTDHILSVAESPEVNSLLLRPESGSDSAGKIVIDRESFFSVNGYDESMYGWGFEDDDFRSRVQKSNKNIHFETYPLCFSKSLQHGTAERIQNYDLENTSGGLCRDRNLEISKINLSKNIYTANSGKSWGDIHQLL